MPEASDLGAKGAHSVRVGSHAVVRGVATHDSPEPSTLLRDGEVPASQQLGFHLAQLGRQAPPLCMPTHQKPSRPRVPTDMREAEEVEGLRCADLPTFSPPEEREFPEGDEACLGRVQFQSKRCQSLAQFLLEPFGI
jgi:hypothetical protein